MQVSALTAKLSRLATPRLLIASGVSTLFFLALLLPRAASSRFLPVPLLDHAQLAEIDRVELSRFAFDSQNHAVDGARSVQGAPRPDLSVGVRTVGELFRRAGALLASGSPAAADTIAELRQQFRAELERGMSSELLALRSLQSQLFVRALRGQSEEWKREREELGGDFGRLLERGWLRPDDGSEGASAVDAATLRLLFRVRWGHLVGCHRQGAFGPSLEELRAYYSVYLLHPPLQAGDDAELAFERVRYARALGRIDAEFPVDLAVGALFLQAGQLELAVPPLRAHLAHAASGPFASLARNYFLFAASGP